MSNATGEFKKGSKTDKVMNFLSNYPGVWFSSLTLTESMSDNLSHNTVRGLMVHLKKYECVVYKKGKLRDTVFTIDADSLARYYSRLIIQ